MATTYEAIATVTVGSGGASSITFSSISGTYTDLLVKLSARSSKTTGNIWDGGKLRFNSSTSGYSDRDLYGSGAAAGSFSDTWGGSYGFIGDIVDSQTTTNTFSNIEMYIPNYAGSNNKSFSVDCVMENNATTAYAELVAGLWSNTSAITSIVLSLNSGNFVQYSTATLYGIKNS